MCGPLDCGALDDGCGGTLDCGACAVTATPSADLRVTITSATATDLGATLGFAVAFSSLGPSGATAAFSTTASGLQSVSWTCSASGAAVCPAASGSGDVGANASLAPGDTLTYALSGTVGAAATSAVVTAVVSSTTMDPVPSDNTASASVPVAAISLSSAAISSPAGAGNQVRTGHSASGGGLVHLQANGAALSSLAAVTLTSASSPASLVVSNVVAASTLVDFDVSVPHGVDAGASYSLSVTRTNGTFATLGSALVVTAITADAPAATGPSGGFGTDSGSNALGTAAKPFLSFNKALSVAGAGDRILLKNGTYSAVTTGESFPVCADRSCTNIPADGLIIEGEARDSVILDGGVTSCPTGTVRAAISLVDRAVDVRNLTATHFAPWAMDIQGPQTGAPAYTVRLSGVRFEQNCNTGLHVGGRVNVTIDEAVTGQASYFGAMPGSAAFYGYGIYFLGTPTLDNLSSTLQLNGRVLIHDEARGIEMQGCSLLRVRGPTRFNNITSYGIIGYNSACTGDDPRVDVQGNPSDRLEFRSAGDQSDSADASMLLGTTTKVRHALFDSFLNYAPKRFLWVHDSTAALDLGTTGDPADVTLDVRVDDLSGNAVPQAIDDDRPPPVIPTTLNGTEFFSCPGGMPCPAAYVPSAGTYNATSLPYWLFAATGPTGNQIVVLP